MLTIVATILVLIGLIGTVIPGLPGPLFVFAGLASIAWLDNFHHVTQGSVALLAAITAFCYVLELTSTVLGAKYARATRPAIIGSIGGMTLGLAAGLPGMLIGPFLGAFLGELLNHQTLKQALKSGTGVSIGLLIGTIAKLALVLSMVAIVASAFLFGS